MRLGAQLAEQNWDCSGYPEGFGGVKTSAVGRGLRGWVAITVVGGTSRVKGMQTLSYEMLP
jgi:hypothetical protein